MHDVLCITMFLTCIKTETKSVLTCLFVPVKKVPGNFSVSCMKLLFMTTLADIVTPNYFLKQNSDVNHRNIRSVDSNF